MFQINFIFSVKVSLLFAYGCQVVGYEVVQLIVKDFCSVLGLGLMASAGLTEEQSFEPDTNVSTQSTN
ncbi:MAG: hypothetical protein LBF15_04480 [Candidatus Peribacteria bacterium]|nr:hypothetical protein [Candidatus Peribacteria bacterium]